MSERKVRVRFAPSPTGALHIGGVQRVDAVQKGLAVGLGTSVHIHLTLQLGALVVGAEA